MKNFSLVYLYNVTIKKILVFAATYNEIKNIEELVIKINKYNSNVDILIVDDNSPDGTSNKILILKKLKIYF